jgi:hypothetical protein
MQIQSKLLESQSRPSWLLPFRCTGDCPGDVVKRLILLSMILLFALLIPLQSAVAGELKQNGITLNFPDSWTATNHGSNASLTRTGPVAEADRSRMSISMENRLDHAGAVKRLLDIGGIDGASWSYLEVGGWPALQQQYLRLRPQPSGGRISGSEMILVVQTVVAVDSTLVRMETWMSPDATDLEIEEVKGIGRSMVAPTRGDPAQVKNTIEDLQSGFAPLRQDVTVKGHSPVSASVSRAESTSGKQQVSPNLVSAAEVSGLSAGATVPVAVDNGRDSELEIAVSANGQDIVIGSNLFWYYSNDGGVTWDDTTINGNDPSVAWGQSGGPRGTFYGANIAAPSTGIIISTNGGKDWVSATNAYTCGQNGDNPCSTTAVFPDQEHIASDRWNVTAGGDQVYSAWRQLTADGWGIVCTQDSATSWSANAQFTPGDFPKPAVGPDGFVYVIYLDSGHIMLDKFASCEAQGNPMTNVGGFPVIVKANFAAVACPTPGLDRCNGRNTLSGITVAVDDTDTDHVYVTYANNTNPGGAGSNDCTIANQNFCNEDIVVQDSLNGGFTWPGADDYCLPIFVCQFSGDFCIFDSQCNDPDRITTLNTGVTGRRFMPWLCAIDGTAYVSWYDRRAGFPGGTTQSNNSLTDFYAGSASLDVLGNLQSDGEFQVNELNTADAQCEAGFATGTAGSWPSTVNSTRDSDDCSVQPQLGGACQNLGTCVATVCTNTGGVCAIDSDCTVNQGSPTVRCDLDDCGGDQMNNGSAACVCSSAPTVFTCNKGRGSPKYGDYNGNACSAGRLYMTWASAQAPAAEPVPIDIDSFFSSEIVCCVPQIQVPGDVEFGEACGLDQQEQTLNVCNTGKENLQVTSITSDDDQFAVTTPLAGYPVNISPDFCFPFEATYTPDGSGNDAGTLTINNNDPVNPALEVDVSGGVGVTEINTFIAPSGDFGEVCSGLFHDLNLTIQSNGTCPLVIDSVSLSGPDAADFELPDGSLAGTIIEAGNSLLVPVRFAPDNFTDPNPRTASVDVASSTQGGDELALDQTPIEGTVPPPDINLAIADSGDFGAVCKGGFHDLDLTLFNQGRCDLTISDITSFNFDVLLPDDLTLPLILSHDADFTLPLRYAPDECDDTPWNSSIQIISDSPGESPLAIGISGVAPCPNLVIDPGAFTGPFAFPATVVDSEDLLGCFSERSTNLRNTGDCPLTITDIQATGLDFTVMQPVSFPIVLPPGEETLDVTVRFTPVSGGDPLAPDETTGTLTVSSDDPDASGDALLCGEGVVQSGIRTLVTDITIGFPEIVDSVDSMTVKSKGKGIPGPINLMFTDVTPLLATVCDNGINYHLNLEILPAVETTTGNGKSHYQINAMEGNLQDSRAFNLDQCEFNEFQMQLKSSDGDGECLLLGKGEACESAAECCSGKCKGPNGGKTCK